MNRNWQYLVNTFFVNTRKSMKNALSLTTDHLAKLTSNMSDPDIAAIRIAFLPFHDAFAISYGQLQGKLGAYQGKTHTTEEFLEDLAKGKINLWRGQVFAIFPEGTSDAIAIFPRDREPFQSGTYEQRIEAVRTLGNELATYTGQPTLLTLSAAVLAYHSNLLGARALQQSDEGTVDFLRLILKSNHKILCDWLYKNLGALMMKYFDTPESVAAYFDLTLIRNIGSDDSFVFEGSAPMGISQVGAGMDDPNLDLTADTEITITNKGTAGVLTFYFWNALGSGPGALRADLNPGETRTMTLGSMGFPADFFQVQNMGPNPVDYKIEIAQ